MNKLSKLEFLNVLKDTILENIILEVWPPYSENNIENTIVSLIISENRVGKAIRISTSDDDLYSLELSFFNVQKLEIINGNQLEKNISHWMNTNDINGISYIYYDVANIKPFDNLVGNKVQEIRVIYDVYEKPIGLNLIINNKHIYSLSGIYGNSIIVEGFFINSDIQKKLHIFGKTNMVRV